MQAIYIGRVLGPEKFGLFNLIYLIGWYVGMVHPGARDVAFRDIPYFRGRKDPVREKLSRDVSVTSEILWRALASSGLALAALLLKDRLLRYGLLLWAVSMFLMRMAELYNAIGTVEEDFVFVSWVNCTRLALAFGFVLASIRWLGIYAPVLAPAAGSAAAVVIYARRHPLAFSFLLDRGQLQRMVAVGVPLASLTFAYWLYQSADRSLVAAVMSKSDLGCYAIAAFIVQFVTQLPADFITVIQPNLYRELGKENRLADVKGLIVHTTRAYAYLSPLAILLLWTWFPVLVHLLLPKYEASIPVLRILSLTIFFSSLLVMPHTILYSPGINRQIICVGVWCGSALLTAGTGYGLVRLGCGLSGVAAASVLGQALAAAAFLTLTRRYYCEWMHQTWCFYLEMLGPVSYAGVVLILLKYYRLQATSISALLMESALLLVVYAPCLLFFNRQTGLLKWKLRQRLVNGLGL